MKPQETAATDITHSKGGVSCSKDRLVVNQTFIFRFYGKNRPLGR